MSSKSVNKVILVGNLGKDPEVKVTARGVPVARFSLATTERFKDDSGKFQERTEWHSIVAWQKLAEIIGEFLSEGSKVYVEGKLQSSSWEDRQSREKKYRTEVGPRIWSFWARERREMEPGKLVHIRPRRPSQLPQQLVLVGSRMMNFRFDSALRSSLLSARPTMAQGHNRLKMPKCLHCSSARPQDPAVLRVPSFITSKSEHGESK